MRKRIYLVLKALHHGDIVLGHFCKLDGTSSRVRNEIYELRHKYKVNVISVPSFIGRHTAYFINTSEGNIQRVKSLLKTFKKENF
ncbi:MAG TPA: hypothetical protein CFH81_06975 [Sulfurovum sp. UBA12169]|nr:MAG TPA: hypothetical protein CFH81_06975 [Sulfurovum sp. UBA12169]